MARIRTIKPEFWTSETISRLPIPARLTFIGLWTEADDYGVLPDNARVIKGHVWPLEDSIGPGDVELHLDEIEYQGLVTRYEADGRRWLHIRSWEEHQRINRPSGAKYPSPPEQTEGSGRAHGGLREGSREELELEVELEVELENKKSSSTDSNKQGYPQADDDDPRIQEALTIWADLRSAEKATSSRPAYRRTTIANAPTDGNADAIRALAHAHPDRDPEWLANEHLGRPHPPNPNCPHCHQPRHPQGPCPTLLAPGETP